MFGIERETLRIDLNGKLAGTRHPFQNPGLERDFCENQLEIITSPCQSIPEAMEVLAALDKEARTILQKQGETLWKCSEPPYVESEDEIPVAFFQERSRAGKNNYRHYLELKYGKRLMLFSGIHFNLSFPDAWLEAQHQSNAPASSFQAFRDSFYLRLAKYALQYSWLLVLLTAASPVCDMVLQKQQLTEMQLSGYASRRNSREGYWNEFVPELDYSDIESYVRSVERYVEKGILYSAAELYLPVRLKPKGVNQINALRGGVSHMELRMFDLNPLEPLGIAEKDLQFAYLLMLYLSQKPDLEFTPALQAEAIARHQAAASFQLEHVTIDGKPILAAAQEILDDMTNMFRTDIFADITYAPDVIAYEQQKLSQRLCEQIAAISGETLYRMITA